MFATYLEAIVIFCNTPFLDAYEPLPRLRTSQYEDCRFRHFNMLLLH